jgi:hypothetical protein
MDFAQNSRLWLILARSVEREGPEVVFPGSGMV